MDVKNAVYNIFEKVCKCFMKKEMFYTCLLDLNDAQCVLVKNTLTQLLFVYQKIPLKVTSNSHSNTVTTSHNVQNQTERKKYLYNE